MKKKILTLIFLLMVAPCLSSLWVPYTAKADETGTTADESGTIKEEETAMVNQIIINQYPSKMIYVKGDNLDFSDMIVEGYYDDGTRSIIADYIVEGYDSNKVGTQTVFINYQNYFAVFNITVIPAKVTNISVLSHNTTSHTLTWDAFSDTTRYEIYSLDDITGTYNLLTSTYGNSNTFYDYPGTIHNYKISAVEYIGGIEYRSELSDTFTAATDPEMVTGLMVTGITTSSVTLTWNEVPGATGYLVYRSPASVDNYNYYNTTDSTSYIDKKLASGTSYKYKVCAYTLNETYSGSFSIEIEASTNLEKIRLNCKVGEQKVRLTWPKVNGASSYDIYIGSDSTGFSLLTTSTGKNLSFSYIADGLIAENTYSFYAIAHRYYNGAVYDSPPSNITVITMEEIEKTSTVAKYFMNVNEFKKSWSYTQLPFFKKYVNYSKSIKIPGLVTTNVGGFSSTSMCPQGITFAEDYVLLTAYDTASEENSVIYVMDKSSKKLLTTLILPSKTHAGGIAYDGSNIWIPTGTKISSVPFSEIDAAAEKGDPYSYIKYNTTSAIGIVASYVTYYDNKLWVGSYNELKSTNMYSYIIENKETVPSLIKKDTIIMPTRVQGMAFTSQGTLILSRSCQLRNGLRGYMRQLDVYKPAFITDVNGVISLGKLINSVMMPSMNEDIAIDGSYLYVNFESGAFDKASYIMDRICAFKLINIVRKTK